LRFTLVDETSTVVDICQQCHSLRQMNAALASLYTALKVEAAADEATAPTEAERSKQFALEKSKAQQRLDQLRLQKAQQDEEQRQLKLAEQADRVQAAKVKEREAHAQRLRAQRALIEQQTHRFWSCSKAGLKEETGACYCGEALEAGAAWVAHGKGEYKLNGEPVYEGTYTRGQLHGSGKLTFSNGEAWEGSMRRDCVHGLGIHIAEDETRRAAIYWQDRRTCFVDELHVGSRVVMLAPPHRVHGNGAAALLGPASKPGCYRVRFDADGACKVSTVHCCVLLSHSDRMSMRYQQVLLVGAVLQHALCDKLHAMFS
jgi:MORN repeat